MSDRFGIAKSTAHKYFVACCRTISNIASEYIRWPDEARTRAHETEVEERYGFSGCAGYIDGCHIEAKCPPSTVYINRKGMASIILQAVVDNELRFIDVYVG